MRNMGKAIHIMSFSLMLIAFGCSTGEELQACKKDKNPVIISATGLKILADRKYDVEGIGNRSGVLVSFIGDVETIVFTPPIIMSDGMTHVITIDHKNRQYWISFSGGYGGINQERGPYEILS